MKLQDALLTAGEPSRAATPPGPHLLDATMFWNPSGGVRRYVLAKREWMLRHAGWRHSLATPTPDFEGAIAIPSWPLPGSGGAYRLPLNRSAAARLMRQARPDLIEAGDAYRLAWSTLDAASALGVPAVAFCHSNLERMAALAAGDRRWRAPAMAMTRRYARRLYERFDLVLAPSAAMRAHLRDWGITHAEHQPLGVDTGLFQPRAADPRWRQALCLPPDARVLVFAGRFAQEKNLGTLVAAVERLGAPCWLVAVGAGPVPPRGERVRVLSAVSKPATLAALLASADVFVHAGDQETFGLSVLEAMSCGIPVVARAAEGLAELVDDSVGCAVRSGTPAAFADAIAAVLARDPVQLGKAARRRALAHDWDRVLPPLFERYRALVAQGPSRSRAARSS